MPKLRTKRLCLRRPTPFDRGFARALLQDPQVRAHLGGVVAAADLPRASRAAIAQTADETVWIVTLAGSGRRLGLMSLGPHKDGDDVEVSYQFAPDAWGNGYAFEALCAVLAYARLIAGLDRVIAETQSANLRSTALLRRVGMNPVDTIHRFGAVQTIFAASFAKRRSAGLA